MCNCKFTLHEKGCALYTQILTSAPSTSLPDDLLELARIEYMRVSLVNDEADYHVKALQAALNLVYSEAVRSERATHSKSVSEIRRIAEDIAQIHNNWDHAVPLYDKFVKAHDELIATAVALERGEAV